MTWSGAFSPWPTGLYPGPPGGVHHERVHANNIKRMLGAVGAACDAHHLASSAGLMHLQLLASVCAAGPWRYWETLAGRYKFNPA